MPVFGFILSACMQCLHSACHISGLVEWCAATLQSAHKLEAGTGQLASIAVNLILIGTPYFRRDPRMALRCSTYG